MNNHIFQMEQTHFLRKHESIEQGFEALLASPAGIEPAIFP